MYVAFDELPATARVWIYQASRPFTTNEAVGTLPRLARFAEEWTSHGQALQASAEILHQRFLVIGLNQEAGGASGCSIDASVRFVAQLEQLLDVRLLDKSHLAFMQNGAVALIRQSELKAAVAAGSVGPDTFYFDNTLATKGELATVWPRPAGQTWLARYFGPVEKSGPTA